MRRAPLCGNGRCDDRDDAVGCPADCHPFSYVFVTSAFYADGALGGLAGADAACKALAAAAGLPGTYKAWLSDAVDSPATRFFHSPYPYVRTDHQVFARNWAALVGGPPYGTVFSNEHGAPALPDGMAGLPVWTNTAADGTSLGAASSCNGWTAGSTGHAYLGVVQDRESQPSWTQRAPVPCAGMSAALDCFQQEPMVPRCGDARCDATEACATCPSDCGGCAGPHALAFVTSTAYRGALGGLAKGDALCQASAAAARLPGTYRAWLSDAASSPSTRFAMLGVPYLTTRGTVVANTWTDLTDGVLAAPLDITELGTRLAGRPVMTGTNADGTGNGSDCENWVTPWWPSTASGVCNATSASWSAGTTTTACGLPVQSLYCFEQEVAPVVCGDGVCDVSESPYACPADCTCGNGHCDNGETSLSCSLDCTCGDGVCASNESCTRCAEDCGPCPG